MRSRQGGTSCTKSVAQTKSAAGAYEPSPRLIMAVVAIGMIVGALLTQTPNTPTTSAKSDVASLNATK